MQKIIKRKFFVYNGILKKRLDRKSDLSYLCSVVYVLFVFGLLRFQLVGFLIVSKPRWSFCPSLFDGKFVELRNYEELLV